jgi:hypothetical protein
MHLSMTSSSSPSSSSSLLLTCTQPQPPSLRNRICRIRRRCGERRTTNRWWNDCKGWLFLAVTITIFRTTIAMPHLLRTTTITNTISYCRGHITPAPNLYVLKYTIKRDDTSDRCRVLTFLFRKYELQDYCCLLSLCLISIS